MFDVGCETRSLYIMSNTNINNNYDCASVTYINIVVCTYSRQQQWVIRRRIYSKQERIFTGWRCFER